MNIFRFWLHRICEPLDGFLWKNNISHPVIRSVLRNEILAGGFFILAGAAIYIIIPWLFWFGSGLICMTWIFWSWARFFLKFPISAYSRAFLGAVIFRFGFRLIILAILLYIALAVCKAPGFAIVTGLIWGAALAIVTYAYALQKSN